MRAPESEIDEAVTQVGGCLYAVLFLGGLIVAAVLAAFAVFFLAVLTEIGG